MRKIVMFNRITPDGYFAAADGNLNWVVPDEELDRIAREGMPQSDTILFGRRTYQMFEGFWRAAMDAPVVPDPHSDRKAAAMREVATWIHNATKWVYSRTLPEVTWHNARLIREFDPREIQSMKQQPGKNVMVFGSGTIVSELTRFGLIDEYDFVINPTILGDGKTVINGVPGIRRLQLLEVKPYASGNVLLRYGVTEGGGNREAKAALRRAEETRPKAASRRAGNREGKAATSVAALHNLLECGGKATALAEGGGNREAKAASRREREPRRESGD